ncbi:MAG: divergent PAP2 family protein [Candidatus Peribacteria bacterium]|jgi:acid phosphatase family membrane protein YuiD|nr:divergent PAP2 family protein [Candidatus Peribacteria bacterium]
MWAYLLHHLTLFFQDISQQMPPIFIVGIVGAIIQITKVLIDSIVQKHFTLEEVFSSGGFPSFHSGISSSVTMITLLHDGIYSLTFAIAVTFSLLFAYDAMNIRFQTGKHAEYLNDLRKDLQHNLAMNEEKPSETFWWKRKSKLKERLGHTPIEVLGGIIFGISLTFVLYYILYV